jgi:hypothetical protein
MGGFKVAKIDKLIAEASKHLESHETVITAVMGAYETEIMGKETVRNGVFIATEDKIVFFAKKMFGYDMEVFPFSNISSIELSKGMMGHVVSFFASGNKAKMKWINHGDINQFVTYVKQNIGKKEVRQENEPQKQLDTTDELKKLAELKDIGVITEEEFAAKKKQLLGI